MTTLDDNPATAADTTEEFAGRIIGADRQRQHGHPADHRASDRALRHAGQPPAGHELANRRRRWLNERYVREWLGGVVTARIVDYDPATQTYSLPREHAAALTHAAGPDNLARVAQFIPLLARSSSRSSAVSTPVAGCPTATIRASTS